MWQSQGGLCAICLGDLLHRGDRFAAVDHDHLTGHVRGLLCHRCNLGIGSLRDDADIVARAAEYLRASRTLHIAN